MTRVLFYWDWGGLVTECDGGFLSQLFAAHAFHHVA